MNRQRSRFLYLLFLVPLLDARFLFADAVDDNFRQQMEANHIPGAVLVVLKDGKIIKQQCPIREPCN